MPQLTFRLLSGQAIRQDVEGTITVAKLRQRILPVWKDVGSDVPLASCKMVFIKSERKPGLFGFETERVELSDDKLPLLKYGIPAGAAQRALIIVVPASRLWGLDMLVGIKLDCVERCRKASSWHAGAVNCVVKYKAGGNNAASAVCYGDYEAEGCCMGVADASENRSACVPKLAAECKGSLDPWWEGDSALHIAVRTPAQSHVVLVPPAVNPACATRFAIGRRRSVDSCLRRAPICVSKMLQALP
eukprot:COSAG05_NODE_6616_length_930_cov_1.430806_2_plen_245_part_01